MILALGTNDLKPAIAGPAAAAMLGLRRCIEIVQRHAHRVPGAGQAKVLVVSPPRIVETPDAFYSDMFAGAIAESAKIAGFYAALAKELGCGFFDASTVATPLPIDGVHLDAETPLRLAGVSRQSSAICSLIDRDQGGTGPQRSGLFQPRTKRRMG